jgi:hypothetical protein
MTGPQTTRAHASRGPRTTDAAKRLADAVGRWLETLEPEHRAAATFPFESDERFAWDYRPGQREGLSLAEMTTEQRDAADAVVAAVLSDRGAREVRAIIALEPILGELERSAGHGNGIRRDPERYWFAVFGEPGDESSWSWRIGGHHVAIQSTVARGDIVGSTPSFLGSNPATVPTGPHAGDRAIDGEETLGRALVRSLSAEQRDVAVVDPVAPPDILSGTGRRADLREIPTGIGYHQLDTGQRTGLERLVRHYLERTESAVAAAEWDRIRAAGLEALTFAWAGPDEPGRGHYYAVRGPNLLIEYDNTQNDANHIHAVWRDPTNDWGEDLLAAHYRERHPG